jgi:hypothetical protein
MTSEADLPDSDLRHAILKQLYDRRHGSSSMEMVDFAKMGFENPIRTANLFLQLSDKRLIDFKPINAGPAGIVGGLTKITGYGTDVIEGKTPSPIALTVNDHRIAIAGSSDFVVGDVGVKTGAIGHVEGGIAGHDMTVGIPAAELDKVLQPIIEAIGGAPAAEAKLAELKAEMAKGKGANDGVVARLVDGVVKLAPGATNAVVSAFASPILAGIAGPVTKFALEKIQGL